MCTKCIYLSTKNVFLHLYFKVSLPHLMCFRKKWTRWFFSQYIFLRALLEIKGWIGLSWSRQEKRNGQLQRFIFLLPQILLKCCKKHKMKIYPFQCWKAKSGAARSSEHEFGMIKCRWQHSGSWRNYTSHRQREDFTQCL